MLIRRLSASNDPITNRRKLWKRFFWGVVLLIVGVAGWVGINGALALKNITTQNDTESPSFFRFSGDVPPDQLKGEGDGRINILVIGIGGAGHPGGQLADTIQIVSIDPINKSLSMLSLPRDLYVKITGNGMSKINAVYAYGQEQCQKSKTCKTDVDAGATALKSTVSNVLDIPIHYFTRIDFKGFEQFIDAIGGIQVYVDKPLNDPQFPDDRLQGYEPLYIPAGLQSFNGERALKYARSRKSVTPGEGSDFARAARQQKVIDAVKTKVLGNANIWGNPKKITDLLGILGSHLKTDLSVDDMRRLTTLVKNIDSAKTKTKVLDTSADGPLKSINDPKAGYIIVPKKGLTDFSEVQEFALTILQEPYLLKEAAKVSIINASGKNETGSRVADKLKKLGYTVTGVTTAPSAQTTTTIKYFEDKPYTTALLKKRFNVTPTKGKPSDRPADEAIIITIGSSYKLP